MPSATLYLGEIWHTPHRPSFSRRLDNDLESFASGGLCVDAHGDILAIGDALALKARFPRARLEDFGDALIIPGFIDTHLHFPQLDMIGAHGEQLLGWLNNYTYPAEERVKNGYASLLAERFITELLAHGTTTSSIYATTHLEPTHKLFAAAQTRGIRAIIGKISMDRGAPSSICQDAAADRVANEKLIQDWHGKDHRLYVALTPRFAPSCTPNLLASIKTLKEAYPDLYVQTHHAETLAEVQLVSSLFPAAAHYLDVYHQYGLLGPRTILGHSIHVTADELNVLKASQAAIAHCPTSNLFLGSGLMPMDVFEQAGIRLSLGTDIGAGTSFSLWQTMNEAYKIQNLRGINLSPAWLFYLATLGGAEALSLGDRLGSFAPGKAADFQVLKPHRHRLLKNRWEAQQTATERLFATIFLADDRLVERVYIQGREVYCSYGES